LSATKNEGGYWQAQPQAGGGGGGGAGSEGSRIGATVTGRMGYAISD